jgi:hypothetical protein
LDVFDVEGAIAQWNVTSPLGLIRLMMDQLTLVVVA